MIDRARETGRVAVAMSGGVDSAVAALLLTEAGHDVVGVTFKLWCYGETAESATPRSCCSLSAISDARDTCDAIGIPHYVMDFEERFAERVIDRFVADYLAGSTPNPCVLCNQHVKFGAFLERARGLGADWIATGHHARVERTGDGPVLVKGADPGKDQSYALWSVERDVLARTMLPVGAFTKDEIRAHARRGRIPVADKIESQDICFVPDGDYARFVASRTGGDAPGLRSGAIVDTGGRRLGRHLGVARYTIGQRRGLGIAHSEPLYVVGIDAAASVVTVGPRSDLRASGLRADQVNWVSVTEPSTPFPATVKIRYRHPGAAGVVRPGPGGRVDVRFECAQDAVTPGQSVVFYDGDRVVGGGIIRAALAGQDE